MNLNSGQQTAFYRIIKYISEKGDGLFLLEGYAGTRKTFLIDSIISATLLQNKYKRFALSAPTNKAVKELKKSAKLNADKVDFSTIHRLLGLKEEITDQGQQVFKNDKMESISIDSYNILVIDEVSMLPDELFKEIVRFRKRLKIIFMGDPAQIPPVGKVDCIPFTEAGRI